MWRLCGGNSKKKNCITYTTKNLNPQPQPHAPQILPFNQHSQFKPV